jgi:hypothetical protein
MRRKGVFSLFEEGRKEGGLILRRKMRYVRM